MVDAHRVPDRLERIEGFDVISCTVIRVINGRGHLGNRAGDVFSRVFDNSDVVIAPARGQPRRYRLP